MGAMMEREEWKQVVGYEGIYEVSDWGQVRRVGKATLKQACGNHGYPCVRLSKNGKTKLFLVHRLVADAFLGGISSGYQVDHIDRCRNNNKATNLRICLPSQNAVNSRPSGKSLYKGVCWHKKAQKWMAYTSVNRRSYYIGLFDDEVQAAIAHDKAAKEMHGEFAYLNFSGMGL